MARQAELQKAGMDLAGILSTSMEPSRIAMGTWAIGGWMWGGTDEVESIVTIRAAVEHGINIIDTAPAYGFGRSEEIVGKALAEGNLRSRVLIATKVGLEWEGGRVFRNASRARILQEINESLRRLRTDYIDIYQVHWPDPLVTIEETAEAMHTLFEQGKIRAIGVSNFSVGQMERFRRVAPLHVLQPPYNLFERGIEPDILPYCRKHNIATFGYGALCRGLLSGRMRVDSKFEGDDLRRSDPKFQQPRFAQYLAAVERLDRFAQQRFGKRVIHFGDPLDARPGHHNGVVGSSPPRPVAAGRRGERVVARCARQGGDRSYPEHDGQRADWSGIHGAAGALQLGGLNGGPHGANILKRERQRSLSMTPRRSVLSRSVCHV
jgi:aryl-alcohol dehydrogenase-like predicted oxidoreductase